MFWLYAALWLYAGLRLHAESKTWDPSGRIRCLLALLLLVVVLQWREPDTMRRGAVSDSINKAGSIGGSGAGVQGWKSLLSARHDDEDGSDFSALDCWGLDLHQSVEDSPGSESTSAFPRLMSLMVEGRLLPPPASASVLSDG